MAQTLFNELNDDSISGVALKNLTAKKSILGYLITTGDATIAELSKELSLSAPTITSLMNDLISDGIIKDCGKVESTGGRRPNLYGLVPDSAFFVGVDVRRDHVNIGISDLQKNMITQKENVPYQFSNTQESLDQLCFIIKNFIEKSHIQQEKILGVGVNLSGRINYVTGYSYSFFHFGEEPLSKVLESALGIKVYLENDSRASAYGEFSSGVVTVERNVLYLNLDYGLGMGIMFDGQLYYGKSGFAGEVGHIPFFGNEIICQCGKKGCLETEASGWALTRIFKERIQDGYSTSVNIDPKLLRFEDIIKAATNDDMLSIEVVAEMGEKLGRAIAMLINVFNPELIILGGGLARAGDLLSLPLKSAVSKYSLSLVNNDTKLKVSKLGERAGVIGACLLIRNRILSLL